MGKSSIRGNRLLCKAAEKLGIDTVFGLPGTQSIDVFDALRNSSIRTVLATTETAAAFMANGYYRACGRPALVVTITGPGFTHALSGLAEAQHDSAAMLFLVVSYREVVDRKYGLQDIDLKSIAGSIVKGIIEIDDAGDIAGAMTKAFALATSGEPGPVLIHVDRWKMSEMTEDFDVLPAASSDRSFDISDEVDKVAGLIAKSGKIAIFAGQGAQESSKAVIQLAEHLGSPVVTTCSGRGVIPEDHYLSYDADMSIGQVELVNKLFKRCDLILALGCKFAHNGTAGFELSIPPEKLIHVDASDDVLTSGNYPADTSVNSNVQSFLELLWERRDSFSKRSGGFSHESVSDMKADLKKMKMSVIPFEPSIDCEACSGLSDFFASLNDLLPESACIVTDAGLHQSVTRNYATVRSPRSLIVPSDYQSTGYGLPAAIGAKLARPEGTVVAIIGDGCLTASAMELGTAVREKADLTVVVLNDQSLGSVRLQQIAAFGEEFAVRLHNPDLRKLAESTRATYFLLDDKPQVVIRKCLETTGVKLLEIRLKDSPEVSKLRSKSIAREKLSASLIGDAVRIIKRSIKKD